MDLHSFPTLPLPYELDPSALRPGVCTGTDPFHTPDELRRMAFRQAFVTASLPIVT